ncbi:MAG TPA: radical SAM protein [Streptosporangiaceae bacterium]|jgi:NifB/MoaA-like Fe-S oxidoreductase|nr:radical SAM protein [Streptosporangiaceae bacterium]
MPDEHYRPVHLVEGGHDELGVLPEADLRQDYYRDMVADRKKTLPLAAGPGERRPNPGHMPPDMALRTIDEAAALGMEELQLSGGDPLLYPHLVEVIRAARKHPGVFVLMNSVGTGVTVEKAREIIEAGLGAWNFSVDTLDPVLYERLRPASSRRPRPGRGPHRAGLRPRLAADPAAEAAIIVACQPRRTAGS